MAKPGRKKEKKLKRIAIEIDCLEEHCGLCKKLEILDNQLFCTFFKIELFYEGQDVFRCSDCHMAERCAAGERVR